MIEAGRRLDWQQAVRGGPVVDKHCIGGIPGNRTSMLVVPIVTAHGMLCPKTSSRAITSPAGTADTMEVLAEVELPFERLKQIVRSTNGCLAWGGTAGLSPADDILISVERPLGIDSPGQMVASILSKKIAAGSTHLVLDIPVGPTAKVRSMPAAHRLRKLFEFVAGTLNLNLEVMITDGSQPVGNGIGPVLEARDVMRVLHNDPSAPADLREKSLRLAGRVIEFDPDVRGGEGWRIARDVLESGRALTQHKAGAWSRPPWVSSRTRCRPPARVSSAPSTTCAWLALHVWPAHPKSWARVWTCCTNWARPWWWANRCTASTLVIRPTWVLRASWHNATVATGWRRCFRKRPGCLSCCLPSCLSSCLSVCLS
jgi:hypothetical protein